MRSTVAHEGATSDTQRPAIPWTDDAITVAWQAGRDYEHARLADFAAELQAAQLVAADTRRRDRIRERLDLFEQCARTVNATLGRHPGYRYMGGPVDWSSGMPLGSACAWLRRRTSISTDRMAA